MTSEKGRVAEFVWRGLRDFGVIVVGVLVALSAESWREEFGERSREREYLVALAADLEASATAIDVALRGDSLSGAVTAVALARFRAGERGEGVAFDFTIEKLAVPTGTLDALVATGDISLLRSGALRTDILALSALLKTTSAWTAALEADLLANLRTITLGFESTRAASTDRTQGSLADPSFLAALTAHSYLLALRMDAHRDLLAEVARVREALAPTLRD